MTFEQADAMRQTTCPQCGALNRAGASSCDGCGRGLGDGRRRGAAEHTIPARVASLWSATETAECGTDVAAALAAARRVMVEHRGAIGEQTDGALSGKIR